MHRSYSYPTAFGPSNSQEKVSKKNCQIMPTKGTCDCLARSPPFPDTRSLPLSLCVVKCVLVFYNNICVKRRYSQTFLFWDNLWTWKWKKPNMEKTNTTMITTVLKMSQNAAFQTTASQGIIPPCLHQVIVGKESRYSIHLLIKGVLSISFPPPLF